MNKILVFGANGQLGQCLQQIAGERNISLIIPEKEISDIRNMSALSSLFERIKPEKVINAAAYTAVDQAEEEIDTCRAINRDGAANLATLCKEHNSILIHVSTDFVFGGDQVSLLKEEEVTNPIGVYGLTKLEGELAIQEIWEKHFILRTSWLYSEYGNNFVKTMLRLGRERKELNIIADQIGSPTYAMDLAGMIFEILASGNSAYGVYHMSNEGAISWYDFAKGIFDLKEMDVKVNPIPTTAYPTKARRPPFSVMDKTKIKQTFQQTIPYWRDSLKVCLTKL